VTECSHSLIIPSFFVVPFRNALAQIRHFEDERDSLLEWTRRFQQIFSLSFGDNPWDQSGNDRNNDQPPPSDRNEGDPIEFPVPTIEELEAQIRELARCVANGDLDYLYIAVASVAAAFAIPICRDLLSRLGNLPLDNRVTLCKYICHFVIYQISVVSVKILHLFF
jgi:hypothetical protein